MTINSPDDKLIIGRLRQGDVVVFENLFKSHYRSLCVYAEELVREKAAAEEVVGDFFLKFWENHENITIQISLKAYLYTSIYNNCLKYLEHLKVLQKYRDYASYMVDNKDLWKPVSANYPLANLISQEIVGEIEQAINDLPDQCREIFSLSRFDELSYDEIAQKLGLSINTVRTQMSRALQKLRESLKEYLPFIILVFLLNS
jgi:RNA polymerase sigma-70 factor (ECF subfamily)